jgi:hypothetical protein
LAALSAPQNSIHFGCGIADSGMILFDRRHLHSGKRRWQRWGEAPITRSDGINVAVQMAAEDWKT